jgi:hypothetical protein
MKNFVLTTKDAVLCGPALPKAHGGKVSTSSLAKLTVNLAPVLLQNSIETKLIPTGNCQTPAVSGPPTSAPCVNAVKVTGGLSIKLTSEHKPVILDSLTGTTNGTIAGVTPQTVMFGKAVQTKLTAV